MEFYKLPFAQIAWFVISVVVYEKIFELLDLDNTIWGGVIGDDGTMALKLVKAMESKAHLDIQRKILIILAVSSKNDAAFGAAT